MQPQYDDVKITTIQILLDSVPDQQFALAYIEKNPGLFDENNLGQIFEKLGIESLGRLWFITLVEEKLEVKIGDPETFFVQSSGATLHDFIESIIKQPNGKASI